MPFFFVAAQFLFYFLLVFVAAQSFGAVLIFFVFCFRTIQHLQSELAKTAADLDQAHEEIAALRAQVHHGSVPVGMDLTGASRGDSTVYEGRLPQICDHDEQIIMLQVRLLVFLFFFFVS